MTLREASGAVVIRHSMDRFHRRPRPTCYFTDWTHLHRILAESNNLCVRCDATWQASGTADPSLSSPATCFKSAQNRVSCNPTVPDDFLGCYVKAGTMRLCTQYGPCPEENLTLC